MSVPRRTIAVLIIGLLAVSQSGNIIRLGDAHPVTIAAWRLALAALLLAPLAGRRLKLLARLDRGSMALLLLAGITLTAHFVTWIAAVQITTVANAAIFFSINPVITATAGHLIFGERLGARLFLAIGLGLAGVAVTGAGDLALEMDHLWGDVLALVCSALFTVYFLLGKRLRRELPSTVYITGVYGVAAITGFLVMLGLGIPFTEYDDRTWLCFGLMALIPTVLGHGALNHAVHYIDAGRISAATLVEPVLAGLVAWVAWDEAMTSWTVAGYGIICASVLVLASDMKRQVATSGKGE